MKRFLHNYFAKILALGILIGTYFLAQLDTLGDEERQKLTSQFSFDKLTLYKPETDPNKIRKVHPQYDHIAGWISSVGAAVAIADVDMDRKKNDIIHVDPRYDQVWVSPATPDGRYNPFALEPQRLHYDRETSAPMGVLTHDFNEDGRTDILVYYWGRSPIIFSRKADGTYDEYDLTRTGERWFSNAATLADFDGDGHSDILITNYFPDGSRVLEQRATDQDQTMQHSMSRAFNGGSNHFFLFSGLRGDVPIFSEDTHWSEGIDHLQDWTLGVGAADFNNDLLPEVYFANDFGPDKFLLNESVPGYLKFKLLKGKRTLTDIASGVMGKDSFKGMGVGIGDMNNDGLLDIFVSNIADEYALEESHFAFIHTGGELSAGHEAPFVNRSESLGLSRSSWGWDSKLGDFNNDGVLEALQATGFLKGNLDRWPELQELALGNDELLAKASVWPAFEAGDDLSGYAHNPFYTKDNEGKYVDIAPDINLGGLEVTRGIAVGDVNYDGKLDFTVANQWEDSYLYLNKQSGMPNYLGIQLLRSLDDRADELLINPNEIPAASPATGAQVNLRKGDAFLQTAFVDGGNGHSGSNSKDLFFGLGDTEKGTYSIDIQYRSKTGKPNRVTVELSSGWNTIVLPNQF